MKGDGNLAAAIGAAWDVQTIGAVCRQLAQALGFPHFLYGMRLSLSLSQPSQSIISGYPTAWLRYYDAHDYMSIDPVLKMGLASTQPFTWDELERDSLRAQRLFSDAAVFGLRHGLSAPVHGPQGSFGLLSLARNDPLPEDPAQRVILLQRAQWFSAQIHERLRDLMKVAAQISVPGPRLSARERECLRQAAQGRSAHDIGAGMNISERTAVYYLNRAGEKLGARSRQHAIALAVARGELDRGCYPEQIEASQKLHEVPL